MSGAVWQELCLSKEQRALQKNQKPCVIWLTGLSGSGKSMLANALEEWLYQKGYHSFLLDGDNLRHGLNADLGFDEDSRKENVRRVAWVARLFVESGLIVIVAMISPFLEGRKMARGLVGEGEFIEVFVDTPLEICQKRDPKGLYAKAMRQDIGLTGIQSPYERPINPEISVLGCDGVEKNVEKIIQSLKKGGCLG